MRYLLSFTCLVCLVGTVFADPPATIIPRPVAVEWLPGMFVLGPGTKIRTAHDAVASGKYLADLLGGATGYTVAVEPAESLQASAGLIMLTTSDAKESLGSEGYELEVRPEGIALRARGPAGFFYGVQTIRQLLPPEIESRQPVAGRTWTIPAVRIEDQPRFRWRGLMLDCARTFLTTEYLRRYIDLLALYKMNVLHLHLTDDEGWRMEVKRHPELTLHGSKFAKRYPNPEGYYTQDDLRELVAYAASRQILIVPEIEMPGHSLALLATYPDLSCGGGPFEIHPYPYEVYGPGAVLCAGNERTFTVLENVLAEVIETFPSPYIHIGGDEVSKGPWQGCPKCQARMKNEALKNYDELQSYFIKRIERFVRSKNRTLLGWDEILEGGLPESAVVMSWRGSQGGIQAARMGHDVVMSPTSHCYFDYTYWQIPTELVYSYDPIPKELTPQQTQHVLGAQANMWTHIATTESSIDRQILPRMIALSEVVWSPSVGRKEEEFGQRLESHFPRLDRLGLKYNTKKPFMPTTQKPVLAWPGRLVSSSGTWKDYHLEYAFDGDPETFYWNDRAIRAGDTVTLILETPEQLARVAVHTGIPEIVAARLASGVLEVSSDGENFTTVQTLRRGTADSRLTGQPVKAVRIRATADQGPNWLMVREFILESASKNSLRTTDPIEPLQIAE